MTDSPFPISPTADDSFDDRNVFLDALLGLISVAERSLAATVDLAPPQAPAPASRPVPAHEPPTGRVLR